MVRVKDDSEWIKHNEIHVEQWLEHLAQKGYSDQLTIVRDAAVLGQLTGASHATEIGLSCFQVGLRIADTLSDLQVDVETLAAGLIYQNVVYADLSLDDIQEQLGPQITRLVKGALRMGLLSKERYSSSTHQIDNIRKMLLAMVDDVRVVLIKLAERLCVLREMSHLPESIQQQVASEAMDIYAPLANRLGVGAMKWEMEDLAFRYLQPEVYRNIAVGLKSKRIERDQYVQHIIHDLNQALETHQIQNATVYGRSKHIHSIYRKMQTKHLSLGDIHDVTAVRILVDSIEDCYQVLSIAHTLWQPVSSEFDDYISKPKSNGYQSLHTAVIGPEEKLFEVQIRTYAMHEAAEMGIAAHWKYKEGVVASVKPSHERKIAWLREVLAWHKEMAKGDAAGTLEHEFLEDRIYVFTPNGEVLDLPLHATPLDFAYHVHTQLGHRCRGVKVNNVMVPLHSVLKTGDRVEVLTGKEERPSRDWLNPHLNYLNTARAKAKVLHWFKMQDFDLHKDQGQTILEKEFKSLGIKLETLTVLLDALHYKTLDDLYAAVGRGDIKPSQILQRLSSSNALETFPQLPIRTTPIPEHKPSDLTIEGVGQLLTSMARCCQPVPGDDVIGYITLGRGVSIHRKDCLNIIHSTEKQRQRFLQVSWGSKAQEKYLVQLTLHAYDRVDLLKDITSIIATEKMHIFQLQTEPRENTSEVWVKLTVDVESITGLSKLIVKLSQVPNVIEVKRQG
jgi:GTP pyrophosphokinase